MKSQKNRVKKLEQMVPPIERQFVGWKGNPWTPEQEAEAIRRQPNQTIFWRSLLETPEETQRKMADPTAEL
jgi:hypothetical protein